MTPQALQDLVAREWAAHPPDAAHDLAHLHRVWANAQVIAAGEGGADMAVLCAAAFLHDLVALPKNHPDRALASRLSAERAVALLRAAGMAEDKLPAVAHAIAAHSFSAAIPAETTEARILQDADRLEALGAVGLARLFMVAGSLGRKIAHPDDPMAAARALDDTAYALDHLETKLLRLPAMMQTATGRQIAEQRAQVLRDYREILLSEMGF
jgi:uncharacterized protein